MRKDDRKNHQLREFKINPRYIKNVPGSVLIEQGDTQLICTATHDNKIPHFLKESGKGWIIAEYSMLPASTGKQRVSRERYRAANRNIEIQRFIGRALRNTFDLSLIEAKTIYIDCDVVWADGGTRCAAVNGSMVALIHLLKNLVFENQLADFPEMEIISAVSIGIKNKELLVDLTYEEDSMVDADINIVSSERKNIIEVQAFSEEHPVSSKIFKKVIELGLEKNLEIIKQIKKHL